MQTQQQVREGGDGLKAGFFSLAVHATLVALLFFSFNWKTAPIQQVSEVTLWEALPPVMQAEVTDTPPPMVEEKKAPEPTPEVNEKVEQKIEEKSDETIEQDIALEKKREKALEKKREEEKQKKAIEDLKKAKELEQKKLLAELKKEMNREQPQKEDSKLQEKKAQQEILKKLQQDALADENATSQQQASTQSAKNAGVIAEYQAKIRNKIRGNVNKTLCGNANPELKFDIGLLPTGELSAEPKLIKSSGNAVCDEAVERAIIASEPLPLPPDASLFTQFRNLKLTFKPNE